jgi:hypothetical protein
MCVMVSAIFEGRVRRINRCLDVARPLMCDGSKEASAPPRTAVRAR